MKLLVTGGAGFIGSTFIKLILNKYSDYKIINLDNLTYCGDLRNLESVSNNSNYEFIKGDIRDKEIINKLMTQVDVCINFAAESHVDRSIDNPESFIRTNVLGTYNLLQGAKEHSISLFIQISTDEVYGSLSNSGSFTEENNLLPNSPYSASKASADLLVRSFIKTFNLPAIITRCSNNYGPYQYPEKIIPLFIHNALNDQPVPVYGDGLNVRDWIYVEDHCKALDLVLHKGKVGEIYNIGATNEIANIDLTKIILRQLNKPESYIDYVQDRLGHDRQYAINSSKIQNVLGWKPEKTFEEGIKETINWYKNNPEWLKNKQPC